MQGCGGGGGPSRSNVRVETKRLAERREGGEGGAGISRSRHDGPTGGRLYVCM